MKEVISPQLWQRLATGEYVQWAMQLSVPQLEVVLWAAGVLGREYTQTERHLGHKPTLTFAEHFGAATRMQMGVELVAASLALGQNEKEATPPAFSAAFRAQLRAGDAIQQWLATLSEGQLWGILWGCGEYEVRAPAEGDYVPPAIEAPAASAQRMQNALRVVCQVAHGAALDLPTAKAYILGAEAA